MAKPDAALLDRERYPFRCAIELRFSDLDTNLHVNNVSLAGILEEGRVRFHRAMGLPLGRDGISALVASFSIEYLGEILYLEALDMHVAALGLGRTSHTLGQLVIQNDVPLAYARTVMVGVRDGRPAEHPPAFREAIEPWMLKE